MAQHTCFLSLVRGHFDHISAILAALSLMGQNRRFLQADSFAKDLVGDHAGEERSLFTSHHPPHVDLAGAGGDL